jgi:hypothetical protein
MLAHLSNHSAKSHPLHVITFSFVRHKPKDNQAPNRTAFVAIYKEAHPLQVEDATLVHTEMRLHTFVLRLLARVFLQGRFHANQAHVAQQQGWESPVIGRKIIPK